MQRSCGSHSAGMTRFVTPALVDDASALAFRPRPLACARRRPSRPRPSAPRRRGRPSRRAVRSAPRSPSSRRAPPDVPFPWVSHRVLRAPRRKSTRRNEQAAGDELAQAGRHSAESASGETPRRAAVSTTSASGRRPSSAASTGATATGTRPGRGIPSLDRHPRALERSAGQSALDEQRLRRERQRQR